MTSNFKKMLKDIVVYFLIPAIFIYFLLNTVLKLSIMSIAFIEFGLFFLVVYRLNQISLRKIEHESGLVDAVILSFEKKSVSNYTLGDRGRKNGIYMTRYDAKIQFSHNGQYFEKILYLTQEPVIGSHIQLLYNEKDDIAILKSDADKARKAPAKKFLLSGATICLCFGIISSLNHFMSADIASKISSYAIYFLAVAACIVVGIFCIKKLSKNKQGQLYNATVIGYKEVEADDVDDGSMVYIPTFEYYSNGVRVEKTSDFSWVEKRPIGTAVNIIVDSDDNVTELQQDKTTKNIGVVCIFAGAIICAITFLKIFGILK